MKLTSQWDRILFRAWLMSVTLTLTAYGAWLIQTGIQALLHTPLLTY